MTKAAFLTQLSEYLELEGELSLNENTSIEDILEIDSLAHVTIITMIKDYYGVDITAEDFNNFDQIADIFDQIAPEKLV